MYLLWVCTVSTELNGSYVSPNSLLDSGLAMAMRDISGEIWKAEVKQHPYLLRNGGLVLGTAAASTHCCCSAVSRCWRGALARPVALSAPVRSPPSASSDPGPVRVAFCRRSTSFKLEAWW